MIDDATARRMLGGAYHGGVYHEYHPVEELTIGSSLQFAYRRSLPAEVSSLDRSFFRAMQEHQKGVTHYE